MRNSGSLTTYPIAFTADVIIQHTARSDPWGTIGVQVSDLPHTRKRALGFVREYLSRAFTE
jgi:hypothetical protein